MTDIRILIVEDEPLIAEDIHDLLEEMQFKPVGIAYDSETAIDMLTNRQPDLALLDINIEGSKNGIEIAQIIRESYKIPFVFLTSFSDKETLAKAKMTLPYGYIVKPFNENDLKSSIEMALHRHGTESKGQLPKLDQLNNLVSTPLTEKEFQCLIQLFDGATNKQMAEKQFVSINTIKTHLRNLFIKLDVPNRTSAIQKVLTLQ